MENLRPIISGLLGAMIAGLLVKWVSRGQPRERPPGHFAHGTRYRVLSLVMLLIGCFIAYAALHASESQKLIAFFVATPLFLIALWMFLDAFFVRGSISESSLRIFAPWRGWRTIPLSSVIGYKYSPMLGCHVLLTEHHGKIRLSEHMEGVDRVADYLSGVPRDDA